CAHESMLLLKAFRTDPPPETGHQQPNHGYLDERLARLDLAFVVLDQAKLRSTTQPHYSLDTFRQACGSSSGSDPDSSCDVVQRRRVSLAMSRWRYCRRRSTVAASA